MIILQNCEYIFPCVLWSYNMNAIIIKYNY